MKKTYTQQELVPKLKLVDEKSQKYLIQELNDALSKIRI